MQKAFSNIESKVIHAGEPKPRVQGAIVLPIFQTAMAEYLGEGSYHDVKYIRLNNLPNHLALHQKLAALENAEAAVVTASGMAAITTALLTVLHNGDHLLIQENLYGGTFDFVTKDFSTFGISYDFINAADPGSWKRKLKPNTKAIYVESISNPLMHVPDLKAVVEFARSHDLISMIDNTFTSPVNFRPSEFGFDLSLHSCTKYLNGHNDLVAGACIGRADLITKIKHKLDHLGGSLDPHAAFLLHRGIKTLVLRVRHQNESALKIARFLEKHFAVEHVNYAGLESHPQHHFAKECFEGYSGMLSFEPKGGMRATEQFLERASLPALAPSLGGVDTLMVRPAVTSHAGLEPEERKRLGITDSLIRMSIGIEATEDIIEDLDQALNNIK
jgi:cystathionine beta-lyase/cystathionine gamma-synthase